MNRQLLQILNRFENSDYLTAEEIAAKENLSPKTIRVRIQDLIGEIKDKGAAIETRRGMGYRLVITDQEKYATWRQKMTESLDSKIPEQKEERQEFILSTLLERRDYIKRQELADLLYISERSVSQDLKEIENFLSRYDLRIEKTPFYGMRILGGEYEKRQCLADFILQNCIQMPLKGNQDRRMLGKIIQMSLEDYDVQIPEMSFASLAAYLDVMIQRTKDGFFIENMPKSDDGEMTVEKQVSHCLVQRLQEKMGVPELNASEERYISVLLQNSRIADHGLKDGTEIATHLLDLMNEMLQAVKERFGLDFSENIEFRTLMNHHLKYFDSRMKYYIPLKNPILDTIKEQHMFAYAIAEQAAIPLNLYYNRKIPEDEIGYFALLFQIALDDTNTNVQKRSILLVCVPGKISSKFLESSLKQEFENGLRNIISCDVHDLDKIDFNDIEFVLTTIPLNQALPVPAIRINEFLDKNELQSIQMEMDEQKTGFIGNYYRQELFFSGIRGNSKEDVLRQICENIKKIRDLPEDFYEQIMIRERYGGTDYRRLIAIPHPYQWKKNEDMVCVAVLDKPIFWERNEVQLIVLAALSDTKRAETQRFYDITMNALMNEKAVRKVTEEKTWSSWIRALSENTQ